MSCFPDAVLGLLAVCVLLSSAGISVQEVLSQCREAMHPALTGCGPEPAQSGHFWLLLDALSIAPLPDLSPPHHASLRIGNVWPHCDPWWERV
jgi:hypothetical protein